MKKRQMIRQGDVLLAPCRRPTGELKPVNGLTLALGEATGHHHTVTVMEADTVTMPPAQLFEAPSGERYLLVDRECQLTHQEHGGLNLAPGAYKVVRQHEYQHGQSQRVAD